jgi:hypothetical protein
MKRILILLLIISYSLWSNTIIERQKVITNENFDLKVSYKIVNKKVELTVVAKNKSIYAGGGLSISFPQFKNDKRILHKKGEGFSSVKAFNSGSKVWNNKYKVAVISEYLMVEGWAKKWKKNELKKISLTINANELDKLRVFVRANIVNKKIEYSIPLSGFLNKQSSYDEEILIPIKQVSKEYKKRKVEDSYIEEKITGDFNLNIKYKVLKNKIKLIVHTDSNKKGGVSISFPQFDDSSNIISKSGKGFTSIKTYNKGSKISSKDKKIVRSDYLLVEGWNSKNQNKENKKLELLINTKDMDFLKVYVRANDLLYKKGEERTSIIDEKEGVVPITGYLNKQGFFNKQITISTQNNSKVLPKINEYHYKDINILAKTDEFIITYSKEEALVKIWDKKTNKFLKNFENIFHLRELTLINNVIYFTHGPRVKFSKIDLKKFTLENLFENKVGMYIGDLILTDESIVFAYKSFRYSVMYFKYDLKNTTIEDRFIFSVGGASLPKDFKISKNKQLVYLKDLEWYEINLNEKKIGSTLPGKTKPIKFKKIVSSLLLSNKYPVYNIEEKQNSSRYYQSQNKFIKNIDIRKHDYNSKKLFITAKTDFINNDQYDILFLTNKTFTNKNIYSQFHFGGASFGCYFEDSKITTVKEKIIVEYNCEGTTGDKYFIFDDMGKLHRKIGKQTPYSKLNTDTLRIYDNKNYIVNNNFIEVLDDNFKTIKILENTFSKRVENIKVNKIEVFFQNNVIMYYDLNTEEYLYTKYIFDKDTYVIVLKEGFIDGKGNFQDYLHFIDNSYNVFFLNQFYDYFFRPDLVKLKLAGKDISKYTNGLTYEDALMNPPPKIKLTKVDNQKIENSGFKNEDVNVKKDKVKLSFDVNEYNNGGIGLIRIYQEGKLIKTIGEGKVNKQAANVDTIVEQDNINNKMKLAQNEYINKMNETVTRSIDTPISEEDSVGVVKTIDIQNKEGEYTIELDLISGKNEITIEAFNKTNTVTSFKEALIINANIPKKEPKLYAIVAGVNKFEAKWASDLKYSENDAKAIKKAIENEQGKKYKDIEIKYHVGKDVTKDKILKSIQEISKKATLEDTIVFYISTHGKVYKGDLLLIPQNNANIKNAINFEEIFKNMQEVKALKQIFVLDTCESGKANDIVSSVYDSKASVLAKSSGVHMLLATTKGTYAFEHPDPNVKNGVFTHKILSKLRDKETDKNKDNFISIIELSNKLKEPTNNEDYQYPIIRNVGGDILVKKVE